MNDLRADRGASIAFDIGNVCLAISGKRCQEATGIREDMPEWRELSHDYECGHVSTEDFLLKAERLVPRHHQLKGGMREAFNAKLLQPIPGMEALLRKVSNLGIRPVFFSDISPLHLECFRSRFSGAADYQGIYSFEVGDWKPSAAMFSAFESRFGKPLLYVDDRLELIEAAIVHGWENSLCFKNVTELEKRIEEIR